MPYFVFRKPKGTLKWTLSSRFESHAQGCNARDTYARASADTVVRMIKAETEGEARGKNGVIWNAITNDYDS